MGSSLTKIVFPGQRIYHGREYTIETLRGREFKAKTRNNNEVVGAYFDVGSTNTILFSHGNAEDIFVSFGWYKELAERLAVNFCVYDYSGYGMSSGEASEDEVYADVDAVLAYLTNTRKIPLSNIILFGRSLGSGPTIYLSARLSLSNTPPAAMMLQSPLKSIFRVAWDTRWTLLGDLFPNIDRIPHVACPVFIIHGNVDEVVPFNHGTELFEATRLKYRAKSYWVDGAGHNNLESVAGRAYLTAITDFLTQVPILNAAMVDEVKEDDSILSSIYCFFSSSSSSTTT